MHLFSRLTLALLFLPFTSIVNASPIVLTSLVNAAYNGDQGQFGGGDFDGTVQVSQGFAYPTDQSGVNLADDGASFSETNFTFSDSGFLMDFALQESGALGAFASLNVSIYFTPLQNMTYSLTGAFDFLNNSGQVYTYMYLLPSNSSTLLFESGQIETSATSGTIGLGDDTGHAQNKLSGSLSGQLSAGTGYRFGIFSRLISNTGLASGSGQYGLSLAPSSSGGGSSNTNNGVASVPAPSLLLTFLPGLLILIYRSRKRGQDQVPGLIEQYPFIAAG